MLRAIGRGRVARGEDRGPLARRARAGPWWSVEAAFSAQFSVRCDCPPVALRHHRVGERADDDIAQSFPRNVGAAGRGASKQLAFPFEPPWSEDTPAVVLASMAKPAEGLCAVYLATVGQMSRGKISAWGETVEVWRRRSSAAGRRRRRPMVGDEGLIREKGGILHRPRHRRPQGIAVPQTAISETWRSGHLVPW
jgi:hypothetical protein